MTDEQLALTHQPVALVCGEPRLRRILRLALEAGGYAVRDCQQLRELPAPGELAAAVVDLDSLRPRPVAPGASLRACGVPDGVPALFISVYPAEPEDWPRHGLADYLQPPFPTDEVARRVERLLRQRGRGASAAAANGSRPEA